MQTTAHGEPIEEAETTAAKALLPELKDHLELTRNFMNLIGETVTSLGMRRIEECSQSFQVTSLLLIRLANDLRCMALLAERGYPLQALTISSSIYEVGITIARIGADDGLAQKWIDHDRPDQAFLNLKTATKEVFRQCGIPDPEKQAELDYRVYQQFCMAKHGNPLLQTAHGLIQQGRDVSLQNGPDTSEIAVNNSWYAMDHATRFVYVALAIFASNHLPTEHQSRIAERAKQLAERRNELKKRAVQRWGNEDPFQGKWKA